MTGVATRPATTLGSAPFHPRHDNNHDPGAANQFQFIQQPVQPGHPDIVNPFHAVTHNLGRHNGFFRHRQVAGPGANDGDCSRSFGKWLFSPL